MSLPEAPGCKRAPKLERRSLMVGIVALVGTCTVLAGCSGGFRPLYGSLGGNADAKLARVSITSIPGRVGQRIRNELRFHTSDNAGGLPPTHRLDVSIRVSKTTTLVELDGSSRSEVLNINATFKLVRVADQAVVLKGDSFSRAAFERNESIFANVRAKRDAENRAARTVAADLRARIAAYLATSA